MMDLDKIVDLMSRLAAEYGLKLLGAISVWIVGVRIIKMIMKSVDRLFEKKDVDVSLRPFLRTLIGITLKILLAISALSIMGVEMTSFIALLGAAGLAVGLALSGTLQNFAGGVMVLVLKPFKVGDYVETSGYSGTVAEIQIFNTILKTPDNKTVILPNGPVANSSLVNYSAEKTRRVDWTFGMGYTDDVDKAKAVIAKVFEGDERILASPELFIAVSELADSSVNFAVRAWVKTEDYWNVFFEKNEKIFNLFNQEGINIPYPQMDVHVHKEEQ